MPGLSRLEILDEQVREEDARQEQARRDDREIRDPALEAKADLSEKGASFAACGDAQHPGEVDRQGGQQSAEDERRVDERCRSIEAEKSRKAERAGREKERQSREGLRIVLHEPPPVNQRKYFAA
jgi:hypothetical protein